MAELLAPADSERTARVKLDCSATLNPNDVITKEVSISGKEGSGVMLNCNGATIGSNMPNNFVRSTFQLSISPSLDIKTSTWSRPERVRVYNCSVNGTLRVDGMGLEVSVPSSKKPGHTERAQAMAPTDVILNAIKFIGNADRFKLAIGVGVTNLTVSRSVFSGTTQGTNLYVGDESKNIRIEKNIFDVQTLRREYISIDGAANVSVSNNLFRNIQYGGVYIYRNCGELGRIRIQKPENNIMSSNVFAYKSGATLTPAIWIGSRNNKRGERIEECIKDDGLGVGSSIAANSQPLQERDEAHGNIVQNNTFLRVNPQSVILNHDTGNIVQGNFRIETLRRPYW